MSVWKNGFLIPVVFLLLFFFVLTSVTSRDGSYLGKILEGFTLAQKDPEEKTVRTLSGFFRTRSVFMLSIRSTQLVSY